LSSLDTQAEDIEAPRILERFVREVGLRLRPPSIEVREGLARALDGAPLGGVVEQRARPAVVRRGVGVGESSVPGLQPRYEEHVVAPRQLVNRLWTNGVARPSLRMSSRFVGENRVLSGNGARRSADFGEDSIAPRARGLAVEDGLPDAAEEREQLTVDRESRALRGGLREPRGLRKSCEDTPPQRARRVRWRAEKALVGERQGAQNLGPKMLGVQVGPAADGCLQSLSVTHQQYWYCVLHEEPWGLPVQSLSPTHSTQAPSVLQAGPVGRPAQSALEVHAGRHVPT
jgi:hypothetical protein